MLSVTHALPSKSLAGHLHIVPEQVCAVAVCSDTIQCHVYLQIAKPVVQNRFMKGLVTSGISVSVANVATMPMGKQLGALCLNVHLYTAKRHAVEEVSLSPSVCVLQM